MRAFLAARASPAQRRPELLLPRDLVQDYLEAHPLVHGAGLAPADVHQAILDWHVYSAAGAAAPVSPRAPGRGPTCTECYLGYIVIDAREGCCVCDRCGVVAPGSINVQLEYVAPPVPTTSGGPGAPRVPSGLVLAPAPRSFRSELDHWNAYTQLPSHTVGTLVHRLDAWETHHPRALRVAAALLHEGLARVAPSEEAVRRAARTSRSSLRPAASLQPITSTAPSARFACGACGHGCHDARTARFHCKPFGVKRGRIGKRR